MYITITLNAFKIQSKIRFFPPVFQIRTKWIPLVNGDAEKGNKYVSLIGVCACVLHGLLNFGLILLLLFACSGGKLI